MQFVDHQNLHTNRHITKFLPRYFTKFPHTFIIRIALLTTLFVSAMSFMVKFQFSFIVIPFKEGVLEFYVQAVCLKGWKVGRKECIELGLI